MYKLIDAPFRVVDNSVKSQHAPSRELMAGTREEVFAAYDEAAARYSEGMLERSLVVLGHDGSVVCAC